MEVVQSLGLKEIRSGRLLCTSLGHNLASTSWADRVDLYGSRINGLDLAQLNQTPQKTRLALMEQVHFPWA